MSNDWSLSVFFIVAAEEKNKDEGERIGQEEEEDKMLYSYTDLDSFYDVGYRPSHKTKKRR